MKSWKRIVVITITLVVICYIFWSTIVTTGIVIWAKIAIEDVDITVSEIEIPMDESLSEPYYRHENVLFKLPFTDIDQRDNGEVSTRFISGEKVFAILTRDNTQYDLSLSCENYVNKKACKKYITESEDTLNFQSDYGAYLKLIRLSKKDLSIFDSRSEKMIESIRLVLKSIVVGKTFNSAKVFNADIVDGVIYTNEDRYISEIFTSSGGYTLITKGISEEELLEIISSMRIEE